MWPIAWFPRLAVHPHTRGEIFPEQVTMVPHAGSPPRAWGDLSVVLDTAGAVRFTPTRVGRS